MFRATPQTGILVRPPPTTHWPFHPSTYVSSLRGCPQIRSRALALVRPAVIPRGERFFSSELPWCRAPGSDRRCIRRLDASPKRPPLRQLSLRCLSPDWQRLSLAEPTSGLSLSSSARSCHVPGRVLCPPRVCQRLTTSFTVQPASGRIGQLGGRRCPGGPASEARSSRWSAVLERSSLKCD